MDGNFKTKQIPVAISLPDLQDAKSFSLKENFHSGIGRWARNCVAEATLSKGLRISTVWHASRFCFGTPHLNWSMLMEGPNTQI